ncbi:MAG: GTP 3',8-cyclase MoaA [bacterium]
MSNSQDNNSQPIVDDFHRPLKSLRISVTDRCNFSCWYCYEETDSQCCVRKQSDLLNFNQIAKLVKIFTDLGVDNVRLTGGEPLLRKDLHLLVKKLKEIENLREVTLTTNGYFLLDKINVLKNAGLDRINMSLDTFRPDRFRHLTGRVGHEHVLAGLDKLLNTSELHPVKINTVIIRDFNEDELFNFINWARKTDQIVRFIEFMPLEKGAKWDKNSIITAREIKNRIREKYQLIPEETVASRPAKRYEIKGSDGKIGVIPGITNPFCEFCDRIRLTADGKLKNCLFSYEETDIKTVLENQSEKELKETIVSSYKEKWEGGCTQLHENNYHPEKQSRSMSRIGG